jgi:hypothetical protein
MELTGIHHLTAVSGQIRENRRFYTDTLGMRLVKRSVNQDDVSAYHLFYADALGSPGSDQQVGSLQTFTVPAGSTTALFGNADYVTMTTGTTAGTITLDLALQYALPVTPQSYVINPVPPVIVNSSKVSTANSTVLTFQGYDNTRSVSSIVFTFHTASGAVVSPGAMTVDVTQNFASYFQTNSQIGGSFVLTATFPVTGDISQISSVSTVFKNGAGSTTATQ